MWSKETLHDSILVCFPAIFKCIFMGGLIETGVRSEICLSVSWFSTDRVLRSASFPDSVDWEIVNKRGVVAEITEVLLLISVSEREAEAVNKTEEWNCHGISVLSMGLMQSLLQCRYSFFICDLQGNQKPFFSSASSSYVFMCYVLCTDIKTCFVQMICIVYICFLKMFEYENLNI